MKNTTGQWAAKENSIYDNSDSVIATCFVNTSKRYIGKEEANANALLMSKAPDLLNALKSLVGIEVWIGDEKMKKHFQDTVYPMIDSLNNESVK